MIAITVNFVAFTSVLPGTLGLRLSAAAIAGAWVGLATELGAADRLAFSPEHRLLGLWLTLRQPSKRA